MPFPRHGWWDTDTAPRLAYRFDIISYVCSPIEGKFMIRPIAVTALPNYHESIPLIAYAPTDE
jgi:hypothetical protein